MIVGLTQAQGDFVLPDPRPERVLLISGGSGITPVMAMLRTLCDEGYPGEIGFLNYARSRELALYEAELATLAVRHQGLRGRPRLHPCTRATRSAGASPASTYGRDADDARRSDLRLRASGADRRGRAVWAEDGLPEPAVETFTRRPWRSIPPAREGLVSFAVSGREAPNSGLPLLEQAEDAGLRPDHGCRMGICNTCSCRKVGRHGSQRHHRRALERRGGADPHLRVRARRRCRPRPLESRRHEGASDATSAPSLTPEQLEPSARSSTRSVRASSPTSAKRTSTTSTVSSASSAASRSPAAACCSSASCRPHGSAAPPPCRCRRSSTTWRSATT